MQHISDVCILIHQEAEDDQSCSELKKAESSSSEPLVMAMKVNVIEASESLMSLYIEMDEIEKELNQSDPLPFKDLHQKKQKLEVSDMKVIISCLFSHCITYP